MGTAANVAMVRLRGGLTSKLYRGESLRLMRGYARRYVVGYTGSMA